MYYHELKSGGELVCSELYDKRDDFNFPIVNFPIICSNIPAALAYGIYIYIYISVDTIFIWLFLTFSFSSFQTDTETYLAGIEMNAFFNQQMKETFPNTELWNNNNNYHSYMNVIFWVLSSAVTLLWGRQCLSVCLKWREGKSQK
jgi:hypothetical protein